MLFIFTSVLLGFYFPCLISEKNFKIAYKPVSETEKLIIINFSLVIFSPIVLTTF